MRAILLIEDHVGVAAAIKFALRSQGYKVLGPARTLKDGIALVGDADAVLLDLHLPDASGVEAVRTLRSVDSKVPLIIHSAEVTDKLWDDISGLNAEVVEKGEMQPVFDLLDRPGFFTDDAQS